MYKYRKSWKRKPESLNSKPHFYISTLSSLIFATMEAITCLCSSQTLSFPFPPSLSSKQPHGLKIGSSGQRKRPLRSAGIAFAGGRLVDESMIVLRRRIHEMKVIETNYEPPEEWMGWEKQCYSNHDEYVCQFVGVLQSFLMNCRPSFALCVLLLIAMSVPASTAMIVFRLIEMANGALSFVHLGWCVIKGVFLIRFIFIWIS